MTKIKSAEEKREMWNRFYHENSDKIHRQRLVRYQKNREKVLDDNREYRARFKKEHPEKHTDRKRRERKRIVSLNIQRTKEYKLLHPCVKCGEVNPVVLVFHHKGEEEKLFNVSKKASNKCSWAIIQREIDKCIVLCSNCHLIIHDKMKQCKNNNTPFSLEEFIAKKKQHLEMPYQI